jgi:hypothetical protein
LKKLLNLVLLDGLLRCPMEKLWEMCSLF